MSEDTFEIVLLATVFTVLMLINYVGERRRERKRIRARADAERWRQFTEHMRAQGWSRVVEYRRETDI